jgi:hypothetical protein
MTVRVAARQAGEVPARVYHWIERGLLPAQRGRCGLLVSCADLRAVAAAQHQPGPPAGPRDPPGNDDAEYLLPYLAACRLGVPASRVDDWLRTGKLASTPCLHGRLVRLADVQALAAQARRQAAAQRAAETGDAPE